MRFHPLHILVAINQRLLQQLIATIETEIQIKSSMVVFQKWLKALQGE